MPVFKEEINVKCLMKYGWVKLPRNQLPPGKGIMGGWTRLASRAAFRKGFASYCGHRNAVSPGMWAGGVVGLKSILGCTTRSAALGTLEKLSSLGYIVCALDTKTKKLTYTITDWVVGCSGAECAQGAVYATEGYGFLCIPRSITERLAEQHYVFDEADAWLDLWCHSVANDPNNVFSCLAPVVQYGKYDALLTLETLGRRWGWEKTKVWRFFRKAGDVFALYRLPGSYGCIIFNKLYPTEREVSLPSQEEIVRILDEIRILGRGTQKRGSDHAQINRLVAWYSRRLTEAVEGEAGEPSAPENRVADFPFIIRAYFSPCRNRKNCNYDCKGERDHIFAEKEKGTIRGPCVPVDLTRIAKECFSYEQTGCKSAV